MELHPPLRSGSQIPQMHPAHKLHLEFPSATYLIASLQAKDSA